MSTRICLVSLPAILVAACAVGPLPPAATPVSPALAPAGETLVGTVRARGVQIYECRARGDSAGPAWVFVAPEADLFDARGMPAGTHYAGPRWDAGDGSKIIGTVQASVAAPRAGSIPWVLLTTRSVGGPGRFAAVTSVQRIDTAGGTPPDTGCSTDRLGQTLRVPYSAIYAMYSK